MVVKKDQKTALKKECYSVESSALRKDCYSVLLKAESLVVMKAQMTVIRRDYYLAVKKVRLIK